MADILVEPKVKKMTLAEIEKKLGYKIEIVDEKDTTKSDRLSEFESIGMSPDELRKAAKLYRYLKILRRVLYNV